MQYTEHVYFVTCSSLFHGHVCLMLPQWQMNWSDDMLFTAFLVNVLDLAEYKHQLIVEFFTKEDKIFRERYSYMLAAYGKSLLFYRQIKFWNKQQKEEIVSVRNHGSLDAVESRSSVDASTLKCCSQGQSQMPQACASRKEEIACDMPVGYSGQVAWRMEQCDIIEQFNWRSCPLLGNIFINKQAVTWLWLTHTSQNTGAVGASVFFVVWHEAI